MVGCGLGWYFWGFCCLADCVLVRWLAVTFSLGCLMNVVLRCLIWVFSFGFRCTFKGLLSCAGCCLV